LKIEKGQSIRMIMGQTESRRGLAAASLLGFALLATTSSASAAARAAPRLLAEAGAREVSEEDAQRLLPRADLSGLNGVQRAELIDLAGDTFDYAGCTSTLASCLRADVKDKHAPRMAKLAAMLIQDGLPASQVLSFLERYYAAFDNSKRKKVSASDCPILGDPKAPLALVEFSDFQCPHCAAAVKPLRELVDRERGKVKLCSKYFPLPGHPRARIAAACAEYARRKGKFWEMSDLLFAHQDELEDETLKSLARQVGLGDGSEMLKEAYANKFEPVIERQIKEGEVAGVQATPSLFVNGRLHSLPVKLEYLLRSVEDEREWQRNGGAWDKD
jgi:protein-disulfide isomerase